MDRLLSTNLNENFNGGMKQQMEKIYLCFFSQPICVYLDKRYEFNAYFNVSKIPAELMDDHEWKKQTLY